MPDSATDAARISEFITRWAASGAAERANYQLFLSELCDVLGVPRPDPTRPDDAQNAYVFERAVTFQNGDGTTSPGRIDLYKRSCFVLEAKQGSEAESFGLADPLTRPRRTRRGTAVRGTAGWDEAMLAARGQAERYARALPESEGWPPFLVVVDVGHTIELYSDFTRSGKTYIPFPDALTHRITLQDLATEEIRDRLRLVWTNPLELDPTRRSAAVTREVAAQLALLAKSLEGAGHAPETVATFLMRCLFTMFAEDVGLIPHNGFTELLKSLKTQPKIFPEMLRSLWTTMAGGGFSPVLRANLLRFNGGLFETADALPLRDDQIALLIDAAKADWRHVEPAIFGTLLERALDPVERHKLGAHYTPRAYVERLVMPTIVQPLREQWAAVQAAALTHQRAGRMEDARNEVNAFLRQLCDTIVLDPACGTGNFLYVTMEHMKRLEGEVRDVLRGLGEQQEVFEGTGLTVDPHQFLGIEINPRAAAIADLVLWIGYLQWHFRTFGNKPPAEPVIKAFHNIECRDAVLAYDRVEVVLDENDKPVTRWDGRTMKRHPVTGEEVPDETARTPVYRYVNPRKAEWPKADYVVGNPPFIGNWRMRDALGDGYAEAIRATYEGIPDTVDYVMYWWDRAAQLAREERLRRFGFIATNSIRQTFNRAVVRGHLKSAPGLSLVFALPDHPWVDEQLGAAVRISMTVGCKGPCRGTLERVTRENMRDVQDGDALSFARRDGLILADLTMGADVTGALPLRANDKLSCPGVKLHGAGFLVTKTEACKLGLGTVAGIERHIREYCNGRDLTAIPRGLMAIDLLGLSEKDVIQRFPEVYQWVSQRVRPEREQNNRASYRQHWWIFGEPRASFRPALAGLERFISTPETARRRFFVFLSNDILPDNMLINIASDDAYLLGVLSSRIHVAWAMATGGWMGVGNDSRYNKTRCFETFPFPAPEVSKTRQIRELGERLDAHRKRQQSLVEGLTLSDLYAVLEKLRSGEALTKKEKVIHEHGLVSVLKQIHDELDEAVFEAYGWPTTLTDDEILERLVALNAERAREEEQGLIRWLRPEFQNPQGQAAAQPRLPIAVEPEAARPAPAKKQPWPRSLPEQAAALRAALAAQPGAQTADQIARTFQRAPTARVAELLETLARLGQARVVDGERYVA